MKFFASLLVLILLSLAFLGVDYFKGHALPLHGTVVSHDFTPGYTQTTTTVDAKGNISINTTYIPDNYALCLTLSNQTARCADVSDSLYHTLHDGDGVSVGGVVGYFTHHIYLSRIQPS